MEEMEVYTYEQWGKDGTFSAKPGQFVDDETFYELRDCVPPLHHCRDYVQVGEAHGYDSEKQATTYATFVKEEGAWKFMGYLPAGDARPKLKGFDDLEFKPHSISAVEKTPTHFQAKMFFGNCYGVSVCIGDLFYSNGRDTYEVAILKRTSDGYLIAPECSIVGDVYSYCTKQEVSEIMAKVQRM